MLIVIFSYRFAIFSEMWYNMRALKESVINLTNTDNITCNGVNSKKRDYYMTILRNSKELTDSYVGEESFKITNMHFSRKKAFSKSIDFYGNIESANESRYISGRIIDLNSHEVFIKDVTVMRIGVPIEENGIFTYGESLCRLESGEILRITRYNDDVYVYNRINREDFLNPVIEEERKLVRGK